MQRDSSLARGVEVSSEGWREAVYFGDVYSSIANGALPRTLEPIVGPKGTARRRIGNGKEGENNGAF